MMVSSSVCKFEDFSQPWFLDWGPRVGQPSVHRKHWEWAIICQALAERGMLRPGARGLGFAVGREPLPAVFASLGVQVDATDMAPDQNTADIWATTNQHAASLDALYHEAIIDRDELNRNVRFFHADMNDLSSLPSETYDFLWSSCALEHLGTLDNGIRFARDAMRLLKPGGVACHTTEFNVSSTTETLTEGINVIYRESDLRQLGAGLRQQFCCLEEMDFSCGDTKEDVLYDSPPWGHRGHLHIKLVEQGFVCTSALLICRRYA